MFIVFHYWVVLLQLQSRKSRVFRAGECLAGSACHPGSRVGRIAWIIFPTLEEIGISLYGADDVWKMWGRMGVPQSLGGF